MNRQTLIPEGWGYEGPDESVGIFGEVFWHEDCTEEYSDAVHEEFYPTKRGPWELIQQVPVAHFLTCPACRATANFTTIELA